MKDKRFYRYTIFFIFTLIMPLIMNFPEQAKANSIECTTTVILSSPEDPYYPLAEEISQKETIPVYRSLKEAAESEPTYLLWVASPDFLSEKAVMEFSEGFRSMKSVPAVGIISGKTIEDAKRLWKGTVQIPVENYTRIIGRKTGKIEPGIFAGSGAQISSITYTKENILSALQQTDVVQISMEGGAQSWFDQSEGIVIKYSDLPTIHSAVVQNYGCNTFRLWNKNSIAMEVISKGAIAYLGFVYTSVPGTRFGDYTDITLLNSWEKFPIGQIAQIQNRAAMQSYARTPHFFLLGDPRIYISATMPYLVTRDEVIDDTRFIELSNVESGIIPIYIENGAEYDNVNVNGVTSAAMQEQYFNSQLQMINIRQDKYILLENKNTSITMELKKTSPFSQVVLENTVKFIDSIFIDSQGTTLPALLTLPVLILVIIIGIRKKFSGCEIVAAGLGGTGFVLIAAAYFLLRQDQINITNIPVALNGWFLVGVFIFTATSGLFFMRANNIPQRILAVIPAMTYTVVTFAILTGASMIRQVLVGETSGINKAGYPLTAVTVRMAVGFVFYYLVFLLIDSARKGKRRKS